MIRLVIIIISVLLDLQRGLALRREGEALRRDDHQPRNNNSNNNNNEKKNRIIINNKIVSKTKTHNTYDNNNNSNSNTTSKSNRASEGEDCLHFSTCACHPCAWAMLIFSASFQF